MAGIHGLTNSNYGKYAVGSSKQNDTPKKTEAAKSSTAAGVQSSEYKLSDKAQKYLDKLRKDYGDYDFVVADAGDDVKGLMKQAQRSSLLSFQVRSLKKWLTTRSLLQNR